MYFKTYKVKLHPNNKQNTRLLNTGFTCLALYNCLCKVFSLRDDNSNIIYKYPGQKELRQEFTIVKEYLSGLYLKNLSLYGEEIYKYFKNYFSNRKYNIYSISNDALKQTIKDFDKALKSFFKGEKGYPKEKKFRLSNLGFYVDPIKISFTSKTVKLEKLTDSIKQNRRVLNYVRLAEENRIPISNVKYYNPRVTYDGVSWWLSVGIIEEENDNIDLVPINNSSLKLGIDMGIKQTYFSTGDSFKSVNKSRKIKLLVKRLKRKQKSLSRKKLINKKITNNYRKLLKEIRKIQIKITNLRHSHQEKMLNFIKNLILKK